MNLLTAIEIFTDTNVTDNAIGIVDGVFRFVSGDSDVLDFVNEDGGSNSALWKAGFLVKGGIGKPSRQIDIRQAGAYGKLSGFTFTLTNHAQFWHGLRVNDIYLTNRKVKVYVALDKELTQVWTGVIENNPYDETGFECICKDVSDKVHKAFPPDTMSKNMFADMEEDEEGQPIPVCAGEVPRAALRTVVTNTTPIGLAYKQYGTGRHTVAPAVAVTVGAEETSVTLLTKNALAITLSKLAGKLLRCVHGTLKGQYHTITAAQYVTEGSASNLKLTVEGAFDIPADEVYNGGIVTVDDALFEVLDSAVEALFSDSPVYGYNTAYGSSVPVFYWDEDANRYHYIPQAARGARVDGRNYLDLLGPATGAGGSVSVASPLVPTVEVPGEPDEGPPLCDVDRTTAGVAAVFASTTTENHTMITAHAIVEGVDFTEYEKLYIGADITLTTKNFCVGRVHVDVNYIDLYGNIHGAKDMQIVYPDTAQSYTDYPINLLPNSYYIGGNPGEPYPEFSLFDQEPAVKAECEVPSELKAVLDAGLVAALQVAVWFENPGGANTDIEYSVKEIGMFTELSYSPENVEDMYTSVQGETLADGTKTDSVYTLFRLLLEKYDGIPAADIDYTNVPAHRSGWKVGRQFTERQNSKRYLETLAAQSFVAVCPDRLGRRRLRCWLEDDDFTGLSHADTAGIVAGSIKNYRETPLDYVYNDYYLRFNFDPGRDRYTRGFLLTKTDQNSFPDSGDDAWKTYFSGLSNEDYADAKALWDRAHEAYLRVNQINPLPKALSELPFYIDRGTYDPAIVDGVDSTAYKLLSLFVAWSSHPKYEVEYALPMTKDRLRGIEIMDPVTFADTILTKSEQRQGWIVSIGYDMEKAQINIKALLKHPDADIFAESIIEESGHASTLIDESGSRSIQIDETGVA